MTYLENERQLGIDLYSPNCKQNVGSETERQQWWWKFTFRTFQFLHFKLFLKAGMELGKQIILWYYSRWRQDNICPFLTSAAVTLPAMYVHWRKTESSTFSSKLIQYLTTCCVCFFSLKGQVLSYFLIFLRSPLTKIHLS